MKFLKIIFLNILFSSTFSLSFIFFQKSKEDHDSFWHLNILNIRKTVEWQNQGQGVRVAILDTKITEKPESIDFYQSKFFFLLKFSNLWPKLPEGERFLFNSQTLEDDCYFSMSMKNNDDFFKKGFKKNHAAFVVSMIRQIAPEVEIISIPIFNDHGVTSIAKFIQGLQQALQEKIDILYIGLKVDDKHISSVEKKTILKLLSQFLYVVAPVGNDGLSSFQIAFPANSLFFAVGAFEKINDQYLVCNFSQKNKKNGPCFAMPGKNIGCFLWNDNQKKMMTYFISGTSIAAAAMVGCLALLLSNGGNNFSQKQFHCIVQKNSENFFQNEWKNDNVFCCLNIVSALFCIQQLKKIKIQMNEKKFLKNFKKEVEKIMKNFKQE